MNLIIFTITYPFIWLLSRLPMRVLYAKSDFLFILIYYVIRYRKKVVLENLNLAFPEKSLKEKKEISKKFFKHFTDSFIETVKALSISKKEILKRYKYKNPELVNKYISEGKSIAFLGSHQANWEWSVSSPLVLNCAVNGAYSSLGNPYFDRVVKNSRERFGFVCYESSKTVKKIHKDYSTKKQGIYLLLSDQSPQYHKAVYWAEFFGVKVPFYTGAEALSKRFDLVVINCATKKIKRGYYETEFELITDAPKEFSDFKITDEYINLTENCIKKQPEYYLWSHKRFKHKDKFEDWKRLKIAKSKTKK